MVAVTNITTIEPRKYVGKNLSVHFSSSKDDWETPDYIFDPLNKEFGFTLDVCADVNNKKCDSYFDMADDGLLQDWGNDVCFLNPPYSQLKIWLKKAYEESLKGATVVALIPARTDTIAFHSYIFNKADEIRFIKGRINFVGGASTAPFPSAIIVWKGKK